MNPKRKVLVKNPRKAERLTLQQLDKMMEYAGAEYIFVLPQIFDVVLSNKALRKASHFSKSHGRIDLEHGAFQGYKLAIAVCLYNLLDAIVRNPGLIGIKFDDTFYDYWAFSKKEAVLPSLSHLFLILCETGISIPFVLVFIRCLSTASLF